MATIYRTAGTPTDVDKCTWSMWMKRGKLMSKDGGSGECFFGTNSAPGYIQFRWSDGSQNDVIRMEAAGVDGGGFEYKTYRLFKDCSAWYHVVIGIDSTQGAAADRVKLYVNGVQITQFSVQTNWTLNSGIPWNNSGSVQRIGTYSGSDNLFTGCMSHFHFIDGTQYAASDFGQTDATSGIWKIKTGPSVTYGNNGFFLKMEDRSNLDLDSSPNEHTFTTDTGDGALTATYDNPSNNFATWNPLTRNDGDDDSLSNGNTTYSLSSYTYNAKSSLAMEGGKWYWEVKQSAINCRVGVTTSGANNNLDTDSTAWILGDQGNGGIWVLNSAGSASWQMTNNDTTRSITSYTTAATSGADSIIMVALDVDSGKMYMGLNGTWFNSSDPAAGTNPVMTLTNSSPDPLVVIASFGTDAVASANADDAGYGAFEYDVPTGFYALCTANISSQGG